MKNSGCGEWPGPLRGGIMMHVPATIILTLTITCKGRRLSTTVVKVRE